MPAPPKYRWFEIRLMPLAVLLLVHLRLCAPLDVFRCLEAASLHIVSQRAGGGSRIFTKILYNSTLPRFLGHVCLAVIVARTIGVEAGVFI